MSAQTPPQSPPAAAEQLQTARARHAELSEALSEAQQALQTARQSGTPAEIVQAQSAVIALEASLEALDVDLRALSQRVAEDRQRAQHHEALQGLLRQAQAAAQARDQYGADMEAANELLEPLVQRMKQSQALHGQLRRAFLADFNDLAGGGVMRRDRPEGVSWQDPRAQAFNRMNSEAHGLLQQLEALGADLSAVLNNAGELDTDLHSMFDRPAPLPTPAPHGKALSALVNPFVGVRLFPQSITG